MAKEVQQLEKESFEKDTIIGELYKKIILRDTLLNEHKTIVKSLTIENKSLIKQKTNLTNKNKTLTTTIKFAVVIIVLETLLLTTQLL
jgi:hypothetical protein